MLRSKTILVLILTIGLIMGIFSFGFTAPAVVSPAYDVIIENGTIIDGTGTPGYLGDLGIRDGRIVAIGNLEETGAGRRIDAKGLFVTPGFIDIHTHSDGDIVKEPWGPLAENLMHEGVTTTVGGNCGGSEFPIGEHLAKVEKSNPGINYAILVGFGTIRELVMGMEDRAPTPDELNKMKELVAQAMEEGAVGLSTGLYYTPDFYASTEEVIELAKVAAKYGGIYTSHMRDESDYSIGVIAAVKEAIAIGEAAGMPVEISHIKCLGTPVWNKSDEMLEVIHQARLRGVNVLADLYAYGGSGTGISGALMPRWAEAGPGTSKENFLENIKDPANLQKLREDVVKNMVRRGGPDTLLFTSSPTDPDFIGMYLDKVAEKMGLDPVDAAIEIQKQGGASLVSFNMIDKDIENFMSSPYVMIGSDSGIGQFGVGSLHARYYGNWPRVLAVYVREKGLLTWEEAIQKMTSMPANQLGLSDRGIIREGMVADVVVFCPETIKDKATFTNPFQYPEGIPYVLINGKIAIDEGEFTGVRAGRVLYRRGRK